MEIQPSKKRKLASTKRTNPPRSSKKTTSIIKSEETERLRTRTLAKTSSRAKDVLEELSVNCEFLESNHLQEVLDILRDQGWINLLADEEPVDKDLVVEFFTEVSKEVKGPVVCLNFVFRGQQLMVTSRDLAVELGFKHEGFDLYAKKLWPEGMKESEIEEVQRSVCNLYEPNVNELSTNEMEVKVKVLHRLLVHSILPRRSKTACAQIQDILVLNKILLGEAINWPKLILHHMDYISEFPEVGYGKIVKAILKLSGVYEPHLEVSVTKHLSLNSLHRWGFVFYEGEGWIKKESRTTVEEPKLRAAAPRGDTEFMEVRNSLTRLENLAAEQHQLIGNQQKEIAELKKLVQKGFRKLRKCIKEQNKGKSS